VKHLIVNQAESVVRCAEQDHMPSSRIVSKGDVTSFNVLSAYSPILDTLLIVFPADRGI
jgi:hypothetical protein